MHRLFQRIGLNRTPRIQLKSNGAKGRVISILLESTEKTVFDSLVAAVQAVITTPGTIALNITTGPSGNHSLTVYPNFPNQLDFPDEFIDTRMQKVKFEFITT